MRWADRPARSSRGPAGSRKGTCSSAAERRSKSEVRGVRMPGHRRGGTMGNGRTAIVTGAARGIGLAIARRLTRDGLRVALADVDIETARHQADALQAAGAGALAVRTDVTDPAGVEAMVGTVLEHWGHLDVLVNNAGIAGRSAPVQDLSLEEWQQVIAVDLTGVFLCCQAAVRAMQPRASGRIVNIASIAGKEGNPNLAPYSAAKAGVIGLTKALGKELAQSGILVNAVTPAVIETDILRQVSEETVQYMVGRIPMGRVGWPTASLRMMPPSFINTLAASSPHCLFS